MKSDERVLLLLLVLGGVAMISRKSVGEKVTQTVNTVKNAANTAVAVTFQNAGENEKKYAPIIAAAEKMHGIPAGILHRLIKAESAFRSDVINGTTTSAVGALGIAQFMPSTAKDEGINPLDPVASIYGAAKYLRKVYGWVGGDWKKAVAGYNWGAGNVNRVSKEKGTAWASFVPTETKNYIAKIIV